jgi:tetratricopeptide (TPR) repeat protein
LVIRGRLGSDLYLSEFQKNEPFFVCLRASAKSRQYIDVCVQWEKRSKWSDVTIILGQGDCVLGRCLVCKVSRKYWLVILGLGSCIGFGWFMPTPCANQAYGQSTSSQGSFTDSIKSGFSKVGDIFTPSKSKNDASYESDPIALKNKKKPSPELYSSVAKLYEGAGKFKEAEQYYQMALKEKPDDLNSMLGYARLQDNQGHYNEAITLYQQAIHAHPKEAKAYNNLGLCQAKHGKLKEAVQAMQQSVQLDPRNPLYRNNLAAVYVDLGQMTEAFTCLRDVYGDAVAYYNVGYLLNKKGKTEAAIHNFSEALRADPSMAPAQRWLTYLQEKAYEDLPTHKSNDGEIRVGSLYTPSRFPAKVITSSAADNQMPSLPQSATTRLPPASNITSPNVEEPSSAPAAQTMETPPAPPSINMPQRLPPVSIRQPSGMKDAMVKPTSYSPDAEDNDAAPLPPGM